MSIFFFCSATIFSQSKVTVTNGDLHGWNKEEQFLGKISFTNGPAKPLLAKGSLEFNAPVNGHARHLRMRISDYSGVLLASITELSYSTFVQKAGAKEDAPLLVLLVDVDGDGVSDSDGMADAHLSFTPRFQNPNDTTGFPTKFGWYKPKRTNDKAINWHGSVQQKVWQTWDALRGGWTTWSLLQNTVDTNPPLYSLPGFIAKHPNARIVNDKIGGGVRLQAGGIPMSDNFIGNVDAFAIGVNGKTTVYDFEVDSRYVPGGTKKNGINPVGKGNTISERKGSATRSERPTIVRVTDSNLNGWEKEEQHLGKIGFANGPSKPPLQKGSLEFNAPENGHARFVRMKNNGYSGILLSRITQLRYSTFVQKAGSKRDVPFVVLIVDADGDGLEDSHIFFDPRYQNPKDTNGFPTKYGWYKPIHTNDKPIKLQGPVRQNAWQTWDALHGGWVTWSTSKSKGDTTPSVYSLSSFIAKNPKAQIVNDHNGGGIRLEAGGIPMANNFIGNVDEFTIGINGKTTIYDFELGTGTVHK